MGDFCVHPAEIYAIGTATQIAAQGNLIQQVWITQFGWLHAKLIHYAIEWKAG